jgi:hypothetical protein
MPAVQQTRDLTGASKPARTAPDPLDLLEQFGTTVTVRRSHAIFRRGDPTELCWRIVYGCTRTVTLIKDQRRQIDEFLWPGDFLGMDNLGPQMLTHRVGGPVHRDGLRPPGSSPLGE